MISVIILSWNSKKFIKNCIDSVKESFGSDFESNEIIVIDNGSKDGTQDVLQKLADKKTIKFIENKENKGTSFGRNQGIKIAEGDFLLFLDADTEFNSVALNEMLKVFRENYKAGIVCPALIFPDGKIQKSFKKFPNVWVKFFKFQPIKFLKKFGSSLEEYKKNELKKFPAEVDYCPSACWLVKKELIDRIGGFDEKIFYSPEDVDFCLRAKIAGYQTIYCRDAKIIHFVQRDTYKKPAIAAHHLKGLVYFFKKHGYWFSRKKLYRRINQSLPRSASSEEKR